MMKKMENLYGLRHGEHLQVEEVTDEAEAPCFNRFSYMFRDLATNPEAKLKSDPATVEHLLALGDAMGEMKPPPLDSPEDNSRIPPIMTYWGQFVDHDVTANTDRNSEMFDIEAAVLNPVAVEKVEANLCNLRRPFLDLDSLYAEGPKGDALSQAMYDGAKFRIGTVAEPSADHLIPGKRIPPENDLERDLPRLGNLIASGVLTESDLPDGAGPRDTKRFKGRSWADLINDLAFQRVPLIGEPRNDENLIVAQVHTAMLRFHNAVVDWVESHENLGGDQLFERARQLTQWHYQWLTLHDFLGQITFPGTLNAVLGSLSEDGELRFFKPPPGNLFMPLEHSVAAYRFAHSMIRGAYDFNRNFGRGENPLSPNAGFERLFAFTGKGGFSSDGSPGPNKLPFNLVIEFDRFATSSPFADRFTRKIDTLLSFPLTEMKNELIDMPKRPEIAKHLARRNLLRGYLLSLPTGQAIAEAMGERVLTSDDLLHGATDGVAKALQDGDFLDRTPLWFYILKEAEIRAFGESLGPVGSRIITETFVGLVHADLDSFLNHNWSPAKGVKRQNGRPLVTIADLIAFTGLPSGI